MSNIDLTTIENALYTWASTYSGLPVIWRHQNSPQPGRAYIVLHIDETSKVGFDFETQPDSAGVRTKYGTREFTVSVVLFGASVALPDDATVPVDATKSLTNLMKTLNRWDNLTAFRAADIIVLDDTPVIDISFQEGDHHVECSDASIQCRTSFADSYGGDSPETQSIGIVNITDNLNDKPINVTGG